MTSTSLVSPPMREVVAIPFDMDTITTGGGLFVVSDELFILPLIRFKITAYVSRFLCHPPASVLARDAHVELWRCAELRSASASLV